MITRRALLGLLPLALLVPRTLRAAAKPGQLFVYNAVSGDASVALDPGGDQFRLIPLPELKLGRWNVRIGVSGDALLMLDTEGKRLHALDLDWVRRRAQGAAVPLAAAGLRSLPLHAEFVPYRAAMRGDRIWVDYFSGNRIEAYRWQAGGGFSYLGEHVLPAQRALGLSDLLLHRGRLLVAASGLSCLARLCPKETAPDPRVFAFALDAEPVGALAAELHPANVNAAGLYMHPGNGAVFVLNAGEYRGGYSSIQRLRDDGRLGPEIRLARNAGAARAFPLDARTCVILQFSGEHAFLFDTQYDRVLARLRFDDKGKRFVTLAADPDAPLSERPRSDLQDVVPDPEHTERCYMVDSKREQLLHVAFRAPSTLELLSTASLRTAAFRSSPSWAVWLPTR